MISSFIFFAKCLILLFWFVSDLKFHFFCYFVIHWTTPFDQCLYRRRTLHCHSLFCVSSTYLKEILFKRFELLYSNICFAWATLPYFLRIVEIVNDLKKYRSALALALSKMVEILHLEGLGWVHALWFCYVKCRNRRFGRDIKTWKKTRRIDEIWEMR